MKRYISKTLKSIAALYLGFPVTYLVSTALLFDIPIKQCVRILLNPSFYFLSIVAVIAGYGLWEMRRWAWYVFMGSNVLTLYFNAVLVAEHGQTSHKPMAFALSLLGLFALIVRVGKEVKVPYFLPKIRWWESDPRYRLSVPARLQRTSGEAMEGEVLDLSMGGCFIKMRTELLADETITLQFKIFGQPMDCAGTVVWRTQSAVTHPKGVGIKFAPMTKPQRRLIKAINGRLKEISTLYKTSRYLLSQEDFFKKMESLQIKELGAAKNKGKTAQIG